MPTELDANRLVTDVALILRKEMQCSKDAAHSMTIKILRKLGYLQEPVAKHIHAPEGSYTDAEFINEINKRVSISWGSQAAMAKGYNLDPRLISKAVNGYLTPQVASALGYKAMRHFNGTDACRIWVKISKG